MRFFTAICCVSVVVALAGCASSDQAKEVRVDRQSGVGILINQSEHSADSEQEAALEPNLHVDGGAQCLTARFEDREIGIVFRDGTTLNEATDGVILPSGHVIMFGQEVALGGGFMESDSASIGDDAKTCEVDTYFFVSTVSD